MRFVNEAQEQISSENTMNFVKNNEFVLFVVYESTIKYQISTSQIIRYLWAFFRFTYPWKIT